MLTDTWHKNLYTFIATHPCRYILYKGTLSEGSRHLLAVKIDQPPLKKKTGAEKKQCSKFIEKFMMRKYSLI